MNLLSLLKNRTREFLPYLALMVFPVVFLIIWRNSFVFAVNAKYSDLLINHLPNYLYLRHAVEISHEIPLWNRMIYSGVPFAANPLSGIFYPLNILLFLFQYPFNFNFLVCLHMVIGGVGFYKYLSETGTNKILAILGGIIFQILPKMIAHYALGHVSLFFGFMWTPWMLLYLYRAKNQKKWICVHLIIILSLIVLADVRWFVYSIVLFAIYAISLVLSEKNHIHQKIISTLKLFLQPMISLVVSAVFVLPFLSFVANSSRTALSLSERIDISLSPIQLFGIFFPDLDGNAEWMVYLGGGIILVLLISSLKINFLKKNSIWYMTGILFLLLSLGSYFPLTSWVFTIPGISLLRVPSRFFLIAEIAFIIITIRFLSEMMTKPEFVLSRAQKYVFVIFTVFLLIFSIGINLISEQKGYDFVWPAIIAIFLIIIFTVKAKNKEIVLLFAAMILMDLSFVDLNLFRIENRESFVIEETGTPDSDFYRIYSPSYSFTQLMAAQKGEELIHGVDPLQFALYKNQMEKVTGVVMKGYSVSIPSFENGKPESDNETAVINTELLGEWSGRYIYSAYPIISEKLSMISDTDLYIYENKEFLPYVRLSNNQPIEISNLKISPNTISFDVNTPGEIILSENCYPGWKLYINGKESPISCFENKFKMIHTQDVNNQVNLVYQPWEIYIGASLSLGGIILLVLVEIINRVKKHDR